LDSGTGVGRDYSPTRARISTTRAPVDAVGAALFLCAAVFARANGRLDVGDPAWLPTLCVAAAAFLVYGVGTEALLKRIEGGAARVN
jgi:hypothetical protein